MKLEMVGSLVRKLTKEDPAVIFDLPEKGDLYGRILISKNSAHGESLNKYGITTDCSKYFSGKVLNLKEVGYKMGNKYSRQVIVDYSSFPKELGNTMFIMSVCVDKEYAPKHYRIV